MWNFYWILYLTLSSYDPRYNWNTTWIKHWNTSSKLCSCAVCLWHETFAWLGRLNKHLWFISSSVTHHVALKKHTFYVCLFNKNLLYKSHIEKNIEFLKVKKVFKWLSTLLVRTGSVFFLYKLSTDMLEQEHMSFCKRQTQLIGIWPYAYPFPWSVSIILSALLFYMNTVDLQALWCR